MPSIDSRFNALLTWLQTGPGLIVDAIGPASADASFRRYFRIMSGDRSYVVMDAPPPKENVRPFLAVGKLLRDAGLQTPEVHAVDVENGFVLLGDLGQRDYLGALTPATVDALYADALKALLILQQGVDSAGAGLPMYDQRLLASELEIFREWCLEKYLGIELTATETLIWQEAVAALIDSALSQPRVCVHRDFHSRNLMLTDLGNPGVLDFQDAVIGPITYDAVSLLRDCYIAWPADQVYGWMEMFRTDLLAAGLLDEAATCRFRGWFDLMGMQRHLKAVGIFARLNMRDGKPGYLGDIPRTLGYVLEVGRSYPKFAEFVGLLETRVVPALAVEGLR
jgi:aminoglycoside/choline kinase family phosphotransferase